MPMKTRLSLLSVAVLTATLAGCVPSDAEIAGDLAANRRAAYLEWKAKRDRGDSEEARVDGPLSLDDAIKVALQYNKNLQMTIQNREIYRGARIATYRLILPSARIYGGNGHTEGRRGAYFNDWSAGFTVSQNVLDASIPPQLRQARLNTALADEGVRSYVQDLISSVSNAYYDVLLAQRMVEVHREALTSAEAQYRMVSEKKKQETATEYDVLRAQVDVASYRANMQNETNNIDTNRVSLLKFMGVSQDSEITFSDELQFLPMRPVFERAVEIASGLRPDLRQAELNYWSEQEAVRIAQSAFLPTLAASFSQGWSTGNNGSYGRNPWSLGLDAQVNLGIDNYGNLVSARARARQRQIEILDTQETVMKEIRQYMNSLANAEETVKALVVNQDAAREALRLVLVGYQAGVRTEVDVTDARKALTDVMGQYYTALANHTKARLNLQIAMGVLGPNCVTDGPIAPPSVPIANIEEFAATDYVPPTPPAMPTSDTVRQPRRPTSDATPARRAAPAARPVQAPVAAPVPPLAPREAVVADSGDKYAPVAAPQTAPMMPPPPVDAAVSSARVAPSSVRPEPVAVTAPPPERTVQAPPPAEKKEQPIFKIKTREGTSGEVDVARANG